jgi:hypothetical protein
VRGFCEAHELKFRSESLCSQIFYNDIPLRVIFFASLTFRYFGNLKDKLVEIHTLQSKNDAKILFFHFREKQDSLSAILAFLDPC